MVRALVMSVRAAVSSASVALFEVAGAGCVVVGAAMWEPAAAWAITGVALLGKSLEADLRKGGGG